MSEEARHGQPGHRVWLCNACYEEGLHADDEARAAEQALAETVRAANEERAAREFYAEHYDRSENWKVVELHLKVWVPTTEPDEAEEFVRDILADAQFDIRMARFVP